MAPRGTRAGSPDGADCLTLGRGYLAQADAAGEILRVLRDNFAPDGPDMAYRGAAHFLR